MFGAAGSLFDAASERERIMRAMAENPQNKILLTTYRSFAREICYRKGEVCIDDVRALIKERDFPMPGELKLKSGERIFGHVFQCKEFEAIRKIESTRPERIARAGRGASGIFVYRLRSEA